MTFKKTLTERKIAITMSDSPLVSILLLSMNHEAFIEQCISSLASQTYKNIEVIYLDNASSDATFSLASILLNESGLNYKTFKSESSAGISANLNFLSTHAEGKLILPLSSDDWLTPNSVEEKVRFLGLNEDYGMVYSSVHFYIQDSGTIRRNKQRGKHGWIEKNVFKKNGITGTGCVIRKDVLDHLRGWDEKSIIEDWDMWIRISKNYKIGYIQKPLAYYRVQSSSNISSNSSLIAAGRKYILNKFVYDPYVRYARQYINRLETYQRAANARSVADLKWLMRNARFTFFHIKQFLKANFNVLQHTIIVREKHK